MTENERKVLEVLAAARNRGSDWQLPMHIGLKCCGNPHVMASSWACRQLRHDGTLRAQGLVKWRQPGEYAITDKGIAELGRDM